MKIADEGAHEPRLAHAGGQGEAQRREFPLEVGHRWEFAANRCERGREVHSLPRRDDLRNPVEDLQ